ncbi:hypothetical protein K466DRAFT_263375 [Polyporus arcularius HHB13444]|uniref:RING-type domain-containing protein n=1 Tax=Polyporus arcularius HHB13444 TaxID=1314778 RepID=A0A5C3P191_9APHY|nr:hypothetical protein K466DRAFT_263375 [Polyporus arcularius HHB13444]
MVSPQHLLSFTTCNVCNVHLPPDWVLEAHYATTDLHPKCDRCGLGFRDDEEFGWHIFECWADIESEAESSTHAGVAVDSSAPLEPIPSSHLLDVGLQEYTDTAGKGKAPDRGSPPRPSPPVAGNSGYVSGSSLKSKFSRPEIKTTTVFPANQQASASVVAREAQGQATSLREEVDERTLRPSSSLGDSVCPPYSPATRDKDGDEGAHDRQLLTSSMPGISNGHSVVYGSADGYAGSVASADSSSRATAPRYTLSPRIEPPAYGPPLDTGPPRHSASSSTCRPSKELPSGSLSHSISHNSAIANPGAFSMQAADSRLASISWHCRLCSRSPCEQPVATMCGHVFCKSCIMKEMEASPSSCCPVCQRMFLLGLKVSGT